jgi:hypothetical protein
MRYEMSNNHQQEKIETDIYKECKKAASTIHDAMARLSGEKNEIIMVSEMAEYLKPMRLTEVARVTGVSYPTLQKIAINDPNSKFRKSSLKVVSDYIIKTRK